MTAGRELFGVVARAFGLYLLLHALAGLGRFFELLLTQAEVGMKMTPAVAILFALINPAVSAALGLGLLLKADALAGWLYRPKAAPAELSPRPRRRADDDDD